MKHGTKVDPIAKLLYKNEEDLTATLTEYQKNIFEKFKDYQSKLSETIERDAFKEGFTLVMRIMIEVMQGYETAKSAVQ